MRSDNRVCTREQRKAFYYFAALLIIQKSEERVLCVLCICGMVRDMRYTEHSECAHDSLTILFFADNSISRYYFVFDKNKTKKKIEILFARVCSAMNAFFRLL